MVDVFKDGVGWDPEPATIYAILPARQGVTLSARMFLDFALPKLAAILRDKAECLGVTP